MADHTELRRKLTAALNMTHLHPDYARGLLRECRDALQPDPYSATRIVYAAWCAARFGNVP